MRKDYQLLIGLIALLALLVAFHPLYKWRLRALLGPESQNESLMAPAGSAQTIAALKAQVATLALVKSELPDRPHHAIRAMVYSRYPLNFKNEFFIDVGSADGVAEGNGVLFNGILIGRVDAVAPDSASVRTLFDSHFSLAVRIGPTGTDALLQGGTLPTLTLIPKNAKVKMGDGVISAGPNLPYGLPLGEVSDIRTAKDQLFAEGLMNFPYDLNDMKSVFVLHDAP